MINKFSFKGQLAAAVMLSTLLPAQANAQSGPQWGAAADKPARLQADGLKLYYDPEKVVKDGDMATVALYATFDPANTRVVEEYAFNCSSHEVAQAITQGGIKQWQKPTPLLPGETLYKLASKLCDWGPGFWKKLLD